MRLILLTLLKKNEPSQKQNTFKFINISQQVNALRIEAFVEALFVLLHLCNTKKRLPKA